MIYTEPKWRSLLANTTGPIFTPSQCKDIINMGYRQKAQKGLVGHKEEGAMILKKELRLSVGFLFQRCRTCTELLKGQ